MTDSLSPVELIAEALMANAWDERERRWLFSDGTAALLAAAVEAAVRSWPAVTQAQLCGVTGSNPQWYVDSVESEDTW